MNNFTSINLDYVEALPLSVNQKFNLRNRLCRQSNHITPETIHYALNDNIYSKEKKFTFEDAALGSVARRLHMAWPQTMRYPKLLVKDNYGRTVIKAVPTIKRTTMFPEPWLINSLFRFCGLLWNQSKSTLHKKKTDTKESNSWQIVGTVRRYILLTLTLFQTIIATYYMKTILPYQNWSFINPIDLIHQNIMQSALKLFPYILESGILILFAILFCWISANFWTALMGFFQLLIGHDKYCISTSTTSSNEPLDPTHRTALIMPICNEDIERVFAGLRATYESIDLTGQLDHFDIYILSDSYNPDICVSEQKAWMELCEETGGTGRIFYHRRRRRVKRKSGNIDDFCRRWGNQYTYMIILDADSVMSGYCLTNLVRLMEANPHAGIIQSALKASGMDTLYARYQQFANQVYGKLFTAGLHFWQLGESHYWGHNAIIRIKPFIKHCALAPLPGKGNLSGSILSHDFVEAALMRRAGWGVWIAYDLPGSYEELPPNLLEELKRDRRWCYGNLMNFRLLLSEGMHPVHRAIFFTSVMSYLSAPLWMIFLGLTTALQVVYTLMEPHCFSQSHQFFLIESQWYQELAITLLFGTIILLFLPKLLSVTFIIVNGALKFGGIFRIILSMLLEMVFSILLTPIRMLFYTMFVTSAFFGRSLQWISPQRDNNPTSWRESFRRHGSQMLLGLIWTCSIPWLDLHFLWWVSPIIVSLILSPWVSVYSSRVEIGRKYQRAGLFLIPEEYSPPKELLNTKQYLQYNRERMLINGFRRAVVDPAYNALAVSMATARHGISELIERNRQEYLTNALTLGPVKLSFTQRLTLLSDPVILSRLHLRLWSQPKQLSLWCDSNI